MPGCLSVRLSAGVCRNQIDVCWKCFFFLYFGWNSNENQKLRYWAKHFVHFLISLALFFFPLFISLRIRWFSKSFISVLAVFLFMTFLFVFSLVCLHSDLFSYLMVSKWSVAHFSLTSHSLFTLVVLNLTKAGSIWSSFSFPFVSLKTLIACHSILHGVSFLARTLQLFCAQRIRPEGVFVRAKNWILETVRFWHLLFSHTCTSDRGGPVYSCIVQIDS